MFAIFDAPAREECVVSRPRTNTPLQALVTLNDPAFVEAARVFGQRIIQEGGETPEQRINFAFRTALAREPRDAELNILTKIFHEQQQRYQKDGAAAKALA